MLLYKSGYNCANSKAKTLLKRVAKQRNFSFALNTTYGLGGEASLAYFPKNIPQAKSVYDYLVKNNINFVCLGNGSNVLASDKMFYGCVISTKKLKGIVRINDTTLFVLAGTTTSSLLKYCKLHSLSGLEYLYGIPATIGGLTLMNGGAGGVYFNSNVLSVKLYNGKIVNLHNDKCNFSYKHSTMRDIKCLILGVFISVLPTSVRNVKENIKNFKIKRTNLPKGKSCGCVFKNPENLSAGKLIEDSGLKGAKIGGAFVSLQHANFIINDNATAKQVRILIELVKLSVYKKFGVMLEEEVVYIGDFDDSFR